MKETRRVTKERYLLQMKGGGGEISNDRFSIPWSRPPIVQVENLFGVEQIVEFPKNSMEKKKRKRERKRDREGECHREKSQ